MSVLDGLKALVGITPMIDPGEARAAFDEVRAIDERAPSKGPNIRAPGAVVGQLPLSMQLLRIGGNLTPRDVSAILIEADQGRMYRLIDLTNESRQKDGTLHSVLQTRECALNGLDWEITPPLGRTKGKKSNKSTPRKKDRKAADFCSYVCKSLSAPLSYDQTVVGFQDLIAHLQGAPLFGHGVSESLIDKIGGELVPTGWSNIAPRRFVFDQESGRLRWCDITGGGSYPGVDLLATYPGRFIQHQPRINGDIPCREGLDRVLVWVALFRNWTQRDWLSLAELGWKPWRTGQYQKGASTEDIDNLIAILDQLTSSGVAVHPNTTELKFEWPKGIDSKSSHAELANFLGAEMSKAVLGQTLTTEQGEKGSHALGQVHNEVRKDILAADARAIAATLRRHLLAPLVRWNFGADVAIPEFRFLTEDPADLQALSTSVKTFVDAGLRIPAKWVREVGGIPEPEEGDEIVGNVGEEPDGDEPDDGADNTDGETDPNAPPPKKDEGANDQGKSLRPAA